MILKCFCDTVILDDFKTALDRLRQTALSGNEGTKHRELMVSGRSFSDNTVPKSTTDIERAPSDVSFTKPTDPSAIYVNHTVDVEHRGPLSPASMEKSETNANTSSRYWG